MKTDPRIDAEKELSDTVGEKRIQHSHYGNGKRLYKALHVAWRGGAYL